VYFNSIINRSINQSIGCTSTVEFFFNFLFVQGFAR
jgi:hypothetical protein